MRKIYFVLIIFLICSCKKEDSQPTEKVDIDPQNSIIYPSAVYFQNNILSYPDSAILTSKKNYELGAVLEKNATLSVVLTNLSSLDSTGHMPVWFFNLYSEEGWVISNYDETDNTQKFVSTQSGKIYVPIEFGAFGLKGKCRVDLYENSSEISQTKYLFWED